MPVLRWHMGVLEGTHEVCLCIPDDHELFYFTETSNIILNGVTYGCTCDGREDDPWYFCSRDCCCGDTLLPPNGTAGCWSEPEGNTDCCLLLVEGCFDTCDDYLVVDDGNRGDCTGDACCLYRRYSLCHASDENCYGPGMGGWYVYYALIRDTCVEN